MAEAKKKDAFAIGIAIDVSTYLFEKNGLKYLPWSKSLELLKLNFPDAKLTECVSTSERYISALVSESKEGKTYENAIALNELPYFTDGKTCYVKTLLEIPSYGIAEYCTLPIMDFKNKCIPADQITMDAVNKSLRRCATKNIAMAVGIGLSVWSKEEMSEAAEAQNILTGLEQNSEIEKFKSLIAKGYDRDMLVKWLQTNFKTTNPRTIKNEEILAKLSEELDKLDIKDFTPAKKKKED